MYNLSILIPARNEQFLAKTIENILENKRGKTEIIVVLDGEWANPPLEDHPDLTIIYNATPRGQRGATNQACRLSKAKYIIKTDAHCAFDEGFDVKLMAEMKDDYTMVPLMYNLHAFDWVCKKCGSRQYQGPSQKYKKCDKCGANRVKEIIWKPRWNKQNTFYRFDKTLHFQYWGDFKNRPEGQEEIASSLSIQGSFFMLTRKKYWELNICDEKHGSWGQQGVEVACKTWLSGGRVVINKKTWYAHMFRTQGGDFGFPYPISNGEQEKAREYSRELFLNGKWDKAKYDLKWLLDKFYPIPDWHDGSNSKTVGSPKVNSLEPKKEILFYTDNRLNLKIAHTVQKQLKKIGLPIISVSLKKMDFGRNIHLPLERGYLTMAKQILAGLEASKADIIYFCEHDVLYHPSHFDFTPQVKNIYYYNTNVWRVRASDGHALYCDNLQQLSGLVGYRETLLEHYRERVRRLERVFEYDGYYGDNGDYMEKNTYVRAMGFEPGTHGRPERVDDLKAESFQSKYPNIDIRHNNNSTSSRWNKDQFRNERYTKGWTESNVSNLDGWDLPPLVFK